MSAILTAILMIAGLALAAAIIPATVLFGTSWLMRRLPKPLQSILTALFVIVVLAASHVFAVIALAEGGLYGLLGSAIGLVWGGLRRSANNGRRDVVGNALFGSLVGIWLGLMVGGLLSMSGY